MSEGLIGFQHMSELEDIKTRALLKAKEDWEKIEGEEGEALRKSNWSREEKWHLIWTDMYSRRVGGKVRELSTRWRKVFYHL